MSASPTPDASGSSKKMPNLALAHIKNNLSKKLNKFTWESEGCMEANH